MGAWSHRTFDNDDAMDWVRDLLESGDTGPLVSALDAVTAEADYVEAPECSMALAAAEVVAALCGNPDPGLPADILSWLRGKPGPDPQLVARARAAVAVVRGPSELRDLWEENAEDFPKWAAVLDDLTSRLA